MPTFVWIVGGIIVLAALKAASEVRAERAVVVAEHVAVAQAAIVGEATLLDREQRQAVREVAKEARQEAQYRTWEQLRDAACPLIFMIDGREVCARVAEVRVRGIVLRDSAHARCFQPFESLQWVAAGAGDFADPAKTIITEAVPPPFPLDMGEEDNQEPFDG